MCARTSSPWAAVVKIVAAQCLGSYKFDYIAQSLRLPFIDFAFLKQPLSPPKRCSVANKVKMEVLKLAVKNWRPKAMTMGQADV
jgi:hypothetical protein